MEPLKITFHLASDMVYPAMPLHLDALLAYAVTQDNIVTLGEGATPKDILALSEDMPIEKHEQDNKWVYKASALMPLGKMYHSRLFYTQRTDLHDLASKIESRKVKHGSYNVDKVIPMSFKQQIDLTRGTFRNLLGFFNTTSVKALEAYCIADKEFLEEYLINSGWITHVGAQRRQGMGMLSKINIESDPSAVELWKNRVSPFSLNENDVPVNAACSPPYWDKTNRVDAFIPASLA